jgi:hypothetical protein
MDPALVDVGDQVLLQVHGAAAVDGADFLHLAELRMFRGLHERLGYARLALGVIFRGRCTWITNPFLVTETCEIGSCPNIDALEPA